MQIWFQTKYKNKIDLLKRFTSQRCSKRLEVDHINQTQHPRIPHYKRTHLLKAVIQELYFEIQLPVEQILRMSSTIFSMISLLNNLRLKEAHGNEKNLVKLRKFILIMFLHLWRLKLNLWLNSSQVQILKVVWTSI